MLQLWKKVVVCMDDNDIFVASVVVREGLYHILYAYAVN